ncbi:hypothetical protein ACR6C2_07430 [Streptomyces sp. INA 01156]
MDTSVTATTPVTGPGPVLPYPLTPPRLPVLQGQAETRRPAPELEVGA